MLSSDALRLFIARVRYRVVSFEPEAALRAVLEAERDRWFLWVPVFFGTGIGFYFALGAEPPAVLAFLPLLVMLGVLWRAPKGSVLFLAALVLSLTSAGFALAKWRAESVRAPVITETLESRVVEGRILDIEHLAGDRRRILLAPTHIEGLPPGATPERMRLRSWASYLEGLGAGTHIRVRATLFPPPLGVMPGGFDFARRAWFRKDGGSGIIRGRIGLARPAPVGFGADFLDAVARLRLRIAKRVAATLSEPAGGIAAALITGKRGFVAQEAQTLMRDSGLAHILAISGLHMAAFAGALFFLTRAGFAAFPRLSLFHPIKKWAVFPALFGALVYFLLSGMSIATQRAFIMFLIAGVAILVGAPVITLRNVALAALAILILKPESLLDAGFHMSFAASIAIVAAYESVSWRHTRRDTPWRARLGMVSSGTRGLVLTSLAAWSATGIFAVAHFNRLAFPAALAANLTALPVFTLIVMPCAVASLILMPLGLDAVFLPVMGKGIEVILFVAGKAIAILGPARTIATPPAPALALFIAGGLWLCLWRQHWRFAGLLLMGAALLLMPLLRARPPDLLIARGGANIAMRAPDGRLYTPNRSDAYAVSSWLRREGDSRMAKDAVSKTHFTCTPAGCVSRMPDRPRIALLLREDGGAALCEGARIVVARKPLPPHLCPGAERIIGPELLKSVGAHAIWFESGRLRVETVSGTRGRRPWTRGVNTSEKDR